MHEIKQTPRSAALAILDTAGAEGALLAATCWLRDGNDIANLPAGEIILPVVRDNFPEIWKRMRREEWPTKTK